MSTPAAPAREVLDRARARAWSGPGPRIIAVDGPAGSGKTTLARLIADLSGCPVVHLDDLYDGWAGLDTGVRHLVDGILDPLSRAEEGSAPRYDWSSGRYEGHVDVLPSGLLVVEGVGAGARACAPYLTLLVWVEADPDERLQRAVGRDGEHVRADLASWLDLEDQHLANERTRERADLVVRT